MTTLLLSEINEGLMERKIRTKDGGRENFSNVYCFSSRCDARRIFKFTLNVFQAMRELHHVLLFMLLKHLQLDVQSLISDSTQSLQTNRSTQMERRVKETVTGNEQENEMRQKQR